MNRDYLTQDNPMHALVVFSMPIILGNLFQQAYNMADSVIVGRYVSEQALAAVGASTSLTNIFICVAIGGGMGASVLVGRNFGAKDYDHMARIVATALLCFLGLSVLLAIFGYGFCRPIMVALNTPEDVLDMAVEYLRIYFIGLPFLFLYNVLSAMFNALGRSRIPLAFLIFSSVFNVVLDWVLVTQFDMAVAGVAWATTIAQGISALLSFVVLVSLMQRMGCRPGRWFAPEEILPMVKIALPSILQQSTVSIGMMLVQSVVNSFGSEALAGYSAAARVESMCIVPMSGIGNAVSSYTAQNLGAEQPERVVEGYRDANKLVIIWAVILMAAVELSCQSIITLFLGSDGTEVAMSTGLRYMRFIAFFYCLIGFKMAVDSVQRGAGDMRYFTIANFVNLGLRVLIAVTMAPRFGIAMVWYAVPIGWFANWAISYAHYRTGAWRTAGKNKAS